MITTTKFKVTPSTPLSGWYARPVEDDGTSPVIVAVHGGAYTSHYWDFASLGAEALSQVGPAAGLPVIAVNRPGSGQDDVEPMGFDEQADLIVETAAGLLETTLGSGARSRPVFVIGHSIGGMITCHLAASRPDTIDLVGISVSGFTSRAATGEAYQGLLAIAEATEPVSFSPEDRFGGFFGAPGTWDQAVVDEDAAWGVPTLPLDIREVLKFPALFPGLASRINVPVQYSLAEFESFWTGGREVAEEVREIFATGSPLVEADFEEQLGHCLHLHRSGGDLNRRIVAFARRAASAR